MLFRSQQTRDGSGIQEAVWCPGKKTGFPDAFRKATRKKVTSVKPPKFPLEEIEDYYTYYVMIMKIPDYLFWDCDLPSLDRIVENKTAYDSWFAYAMKKEGERKSGR